MCVCLLLVWRMFRRKQVRVSICAWQFLRWEFPCKLMFWYSWFCQKKYFADLLCLHGDNKIFVKINVSVSLCLFYYSDLCQSKRDELVSGFDLSDFPTFTTNTTTRLWFGSEVKRSKINGTISDCTHKKYSCFYFYSFSFISETVKLKVNLMHQDG